MMTRHGEMVCFQGVFDVKANKLPKTLGMRHEKNRRDLYAASIAEITPPKSCKVYDSLNTLPQSNFCFQISFSSSGNVFLSMSNVSLLHKRWWVG